MRIYICVCICPNIGATYILSFIILMLSISVNLYAQHDPETRVAYTCPRYDVKTQMNRVLRRINFSWSEPRMFRFPYFQTRSGEALCVHSLEFKWWILTYYYLMSTFSSLHLRTKKWMTHFILNGLGYFWQLYGSNFGVNTILVNFCTEWNTVFHSEISPVN